MKPRLYADRILMNANIYTVDESFSKAEAVAIAGGKILFVGTNEDVKAYKDDNTVVEDLGGRTVLPGLIEGHLHLQQYGESLLQLQIRDKTREDILALVGDAVKDLKPGEWLVGGVGWNNEAWDDSSYPTKEELDSVAPDNPVFLPRIDGGHTGWVNSKAFEVAGITKDTPNPEGGEYMKNPDGSLLGCVGNAAMRHIRSFIPPLDKAGRKKALLAAQQRMLEYGVTSLNEMAVPYENIEDIKELIQSGEYKIRYHAALRDAIGSKMRRETRDYFLNNSPEIDLYDGRFTIRAIKIGADGAVGAQSAALLEDYTDRPGHRGTLMQTDEELYDIVKEATDHGMQVITHAIGDRAIDQILGAYQRVKDENPDVDHRFRIEHFQLVTGDSRERAKALNVVASMQPLHGPNSAAMAMRRLGPDRAGRAYAIGLVHDVLGWYVSGSDAPVAQPDPIAGIHAAVNRTNQNLEPKGGFYMENAVPRVDAIKAYTIWSAYGQFTEDKKGSIEPGKYADFTILDKDLVTCPDDEILSVKVEETIIAGKTAYKRD